METVDQLIEQASSGEEPAQTLQRGRQHLLELRHNQAAVASIAGHLEAYAALQLPRVDVLYPENMATLWSDIKKLKPLLRETGGKPCLATDNPSTLFRMAHADAGAGDHATSIANFVRAAEHSTSIEDGPQPGQTTKLALALSALGHTDEAENFLRWSLWQRPHSYVWTQLGILWRSQQRIHLSIQALKQASRNMGDNSLPQAELGISYMHLNNWPAAINSLSLSVYLDSVSDRFFPATHLLLATALSHNGQASEAEARMREFKERIAGDEHPETRTHTDHLDLLTAEFRELLR